MKRFQYISSNEHIVNYVEKMAIWMEENSSVSPKVIEQLFKKYQKEVRELFNPYPETIFHDDPAKWAELLAINWGLIEEPELVFV
jgi:uncharacterized protein Yka (UPF0111/DUF47 family)